MFGRETGLYVGWLLVTLGLGYLFINERGERILLEKAMKRAPAAAVACVTPAVFDVLSERLTTCREQFADCRKAYDSTESDLDRCHRELIEP